MVDEGILDTSIDLHLECLRFSFFGILQTELDETKELWNNHRIREVKNVECPGGIPNVLYHAPQVTGGVNCFYPVGQSDLNLAKQFTTESTSFPCDKDIAFTCRALMIDNNKDFPQTADEARHLYIFLIDELE